LSGIRRFGVTALLCLLGVSGSRLGAQPAFAVGLAPNPAGLPGDLNLSWNSLPGMTYLVQTTTNLAATSGWQTTDALTPATQQSVYPLPGAVAGAPAAFYRLQIRSPALTGVEPSFVNSSGGSASLYLLGAGLPSNASVQVDGQSFAATLINSNGVWAAIDLGSLAAGTSLTGQVSVVDNRSGAIVATLLLQSPVVYGASPTVEQWQGPPEGEAPAAPHSFTTDGGGWTGLTVTGPISAKRKDMVINILRRRDPGGHGGRKSDAFGLAAALPLGSGVSLAKGQGIGSEAMDDGSETFRTAGGRAAGQPGIAVSDQAQPAEKKLRKHAGIISGGRGGSPGGTYPVVQLATGELLDRETDLVVPGVGFNFAWTRTYRSQTGPTTAQGARWDFAYDVSIATQSDGTVLLATGDGRTHTFYPNGTNGWARDEYFLQVADLNGDGMPDVLFPDGGQWLLNPQGSNAAGKLGQIIDRNGNTMTLLYDTAGRLVNVVDTLNRTNTIAYNSTGQIASVTDFAGRTVSYQYDSAGNLTACISPPVIGTPTGNDFPGGKTNSYAYSSGFSDDRLNHNLVGLTDGAGQTWLQVVYQATTDPTSSDFRAVDKVVRGGYLEYLRRYPVTATPANQFAVVDCLVSDGVGNVSECFFDSRLRCLRELQYTGRSDPTQPVTQTSNRPAGPLRASDPAWFETDCAWNSDSLCEAIFHGIGSAPRQFQFVYERDFSGPGNARKKGDLRVYREIASAAVDPDGNGSADTSQRAWAFVYDPRFGSPDLSQVFTYRIKRAWVSKYQTLADVDADGLAVARSWDGTIKGVDVTSAQETAAKHTGNMTGNHKDCMISAAPLEPGGDTSLDSTLVMPALMRARERANRSVCFSPPLADTDGNGGLDRLAGRLADLDRDGMPDFCVALKDPAGLVVTAAHDRHGNRLHVAGPMGAQLDFGYNTFGQVAAVTNPPDGGGYRAVDAYLYFTNGPAAGFVQGCVLDVAGVQVSASCQRDAVGNVTRYVDPNGNDWLYAYNALDQVVQVQTPTNVTSRTTTQFIYDACDRLVQASTELRDNNDLLQRPVQRYLVYDGLDRCVTVAAQVSPQHFATNGFAYDGDDNVTAVYSPLAMSGADPNNYSVLRYDERNRLWQRLDGPLSGVTALTNQWDYDYDGNCIRLTASGPGVTPQVTSCVYDGLGRRTQATDPVGNLETWIYDRGDNLVLDRFYSAAGNGKPGSQLLAQVSFQHDSLNRPASVQASRFDSAGNPTGKGYTTTTFAHAPNGELLQVTDDNLHTVSFSYDTLGRCSQLTSARKDILQWMFDAAGNVRSVTSTETSDFSTATEQFWLAYTYDSRNRRVSAADNGGNRASCAYDSLGRIVMRTSPNGTLDGFSYDDLGRCTMAIADLDGDGQLDVTRDPKNLFSWDDNSRCASTTDANTNTTLFYYDSRDDRTGVAQADNTGTQFTWDCFGNLITGTDATGSTITHTYDGLNRVVHRDLAARNGLVASTTFETFGYDGLSRLVAATNDVSYSTFAYDSLADCLTATQDGLTTSYTYDGVGNLLSLTYPSGQIVGYTRDAVDQVTNVSSTITGASTLASLAAYAYEGPGRVGRMAWANGVSTRIAWNGMTSTQNGKGDFGWRSVTGTRHAVSVSGKAVTLDQRQLTYDHDQNRTLRAQTAPFYAGGPQLTNAFAYDALDRLTGFIHTSGGSSDYSTSYVLDGNGNRVSEVKGGAVLDYTMSAALPPGDFEMNRYTTTPFGVQAYDADGDTDSRSSATGQFACQYDCLNRLVEVDNVSSTGQAPVATFAYDALGRRVHKTIYSGTSSSGTQFVYGDPAGADAILEVRPAGSPPRTFVQGSPAARRWVPTIRVQRIDMARVMRLRKRPELLASMDSTGAPFYYQNDDLGNVLLLTDGTGNVLERMDYDDFGEPAFLSADGTALVGSTGQPLTSSSQGNPFLFHGVFWDGETGLYLDGGPGDCANLDPATCKRLTPVKSNPLYQDKGQAGTNPFYEDGVSISLGSSAYVIYGGNPNGRQDVRGTCGWRPRRY